MTEMLNIYDLNQKKTAILQNAFDIDEVRELNQIYSLSFSIPADDLKRQYCLPRHYVRYGETGQLYRILKPSVSEDSVGVVTYECEHVIATLCDNVIFGSKTYGGSKIKTSQVITWLLDQQKTKRWVLGGCDFDRRFEYNWEQENLLNALYSVPKEFVEPYQWDFDTTGTEWKLYLKKIDTNTTPRFYLRGKKNILSYDNEADYTNICTRIYPLGYGEGVNQLNIKDVNNGVEYLESPADIVAQYGIIEKVLVDRRFENAETLKAYAQAMLEACQVPSMSRTFEVTDLYQLTNDEIDKAEVGYITKLTQDDTIAYITRTERKLDVAGDLRIELSTKVTDIADSVADLADRVRIESVYAQGATQLYQHSKDANATKDKGMILSLYFPSEMKQINKVLLRLKMSKFRSYSESTGLDGKFTKTYIIDKIEAKKIETQINPKTATPYKVTFPKQIVTVSMDADSNADLETTEGGGGTSTTTATVYDSTVSGSITSEPSWNSWEGGYLTLETSGENSFDTNANIDVRYGDYIDTGGPEYYGGEHFHYIEKVLYHVHHGSISDMNFLVKKSDFNHEHEINITDNDNFGSHSHEFQMDSHSHSINIGHSHNVEIGESTVDIKCPPHEHEVEIPGHEHKIEIPDHSHAIIPGIFEYGDPKTFDIYVGSTKVKTVKAASYEDDISAWLLDSDKKIPRNTWIDIEIRPDDLAYIQTSVFIQGFVQSRGDNTY